VRDSYTQIYKQRILLYYSNFIYFDVSWLHFFVVARGIHFILFLAPMGGWVGDKLAGLGVFLVQSGRFLVVQKLIALNLGSNR